MGEIMTFPDTVEEFMEQYKVVDREQVYTNGTELVPIYRMKQWFDHLPSAQPEITECPMCPDCPDNCPLDNPRENAQPERKPGRWIDCQRGRWIYAQCSECGTVHDVKSNFCPNCGAKMEVEHDRT